jgi:hypothetical protein
MLGESWDGEEIMCKTPMNNKQTNNEGQECETGHVKGRAC